MKKIVIIAAAIATLAACSKNEVYRQEASPISFAPNAMTTKALILPDASQADTLAFPTSESFNVFAFADLDGAGTAYTTIYANPLMNDVNISYQNGDWKATTGTYLWPATGTVDFYAYYPDNLTAVFDSTARKINLTGISLGATIGDQIDPLVGNCLAQLAPSKPKVKLIFKHITSQIAATAFDATQTVSLQGKISIEKVVFKNMKTSGDYADGTTLGKGLWTNTNTIKDFTSFSGSEVLSTSESYLSAGSFSTAIDNSAAFVVVPDIVTDDATTGQAVEITYSIAPYTINGFSYPATPSKTVSVPLYNLVSGNKFQNGKRYVFHLGISLDGANNEIMFSPAVVGWETEDINNITIDAVNAVLL